MSKTKNHIRTVTTKGQVTIPAEIRAMLGIKPNSRVIFRVVDGQVTLQPTIKTLEEVYGSVTPRKRPEDFKELRDIAIEEKVQRIIDSMNS